MQVKMSYNSRKSDKKQQRANKSKFTPRKVAAKRAATKELVKRLK